jgi:hypothetical protein
MSHEGNQMSYCQKCGAKIKKVQRVINGRMGPEEITLPQFTCGRACPRRVASEKSTKRIRKVLRRGERRQTVSE